MRVNPPKTANLLQEACIEQVFAHFPLTRRKSRGMYRI